MSLFRSGGILPQDISATHHREQLRRERQAEYQAFLNQQQASNKPVISSRDAIPLSRPFNSLAEKRRALAREREQEVHSYNRPPPQSLCDCTSNVDKNLPWERGEVGDHRDGWPTGERRDDLPGETEPFSKHYSRDNRHFSDIPSNKYDRQREEQRIAEDRRYGRQNVGEEGYNYHGASQRRRWDEGNWEGLSGHTRQVHFDDGDTEGKVNPRRGHRNWDEEEEGLIQWARGQGKSVGPNPRNPTPLSYSQPHRNAEKGRGNRSLSAPVANVGIAALGAGDSEIAKRKKQREYAEQLRAQMREKQTEKEREREWLMSDAVTLPTNSHDLKASAPRHDEEYKSSTKRDFPSPRRRERVHFSPERDTHQHQTRYSPPHDKSSNKRDNPTVPPYWPGMYYGGYPCPPPPNFPFVPPPPPQNGVPYYPPSIPPSLGNPYLSAYYHPPITEEYNSESRRATKHDRQDYLSSQRVKERGGEEELKDLFHGGSSSGGDDKLSKEVYRAQLMEQMREKHEYRRREQLETERKKEREIYDPFGKGGCGAPIRDRKGKLVTDLKQMKKVNDERMIIGLPSTTPLPGEVVEGGAAGVLLDNSFTEHGSPQSSYDVRRSRELRSKSVQEDYREVLRRQMREREEIKRREKEESSREEKLETERIEKELKLLEEKYKLEKEREKEKQYEIKMKNEAMKREKEEREREREREEMEGKAEEERHQQEVLRLEAEKKKQTLIDNMECQLPLQNQVRTNSPPIPTIKNKLNPQFSSPSAVPNQHHLHQQQQQQCPPSPPVPALQHKMMMGHRGEPLPNDGHDYTSAHSTETQPAHQQQWPVRSSSPVIPALRNKPAANTDQASRSASAHAAMPQTDRHLTTKHTSDGGGVVGSSHSAHNLPQPNPRTSETSLPPSNSDPNPSLSMLHAPAPEDKMASMLKNLRSMRQMLESERQKVTTSDPAPTASQVNSANVKPPVDSKQDGGKPVFLKPRLAGPRKKTDSPSNRPLPSTANTQQQQQQQQQQQKQGQNRQRRQWQKTSDRSIQPSHISAEQSTVQGHYSNSPGKNGGFPMIAHHQQENGDGAMKHKMPPLWLRPEGSRDHEKTNLPNRPPSVGGQSQFSIATLDVESMARRNEERMQRLEEILNTQARDARTPRAILSDFLSRHTRTRDTSRQPPITTDPDPLLRSQSQGSHGS